jgi:hypothetical protein
MNRNFSDYSKGIQDTQKLINIMKTKEVSVKIYECDENLNEIEFEVSAEISPFYPAVMYLRNGDPGYPAEGGELFNFHIEPDPTEYGFTRTDILNKAEEYLYEQV